MYSLLATGGGPALVVAVVHPQATDELVSGIVRRGEATCKVVETMALMASGRAAVTGPVSIHDLFAIEENLLLSSVSLGQSAIDEVTRHRFADGIYIREMTIPRNCILTGAIHKTSHMCVMASGDISILTVDGMKRLKAPYVVNSLAGVKRVGFAHQTTVWLDVHPNPTNEQRPEKLWDMFYHNNKPD